MRYLRERSFDCKRSFQFSNLKELYLNNSAALSQSSLPRVAEVFDFGDETVVLDVKAELAKLVPPECELLRGGPVGHGLEPLCDLAHVLRLPVLGM